MLALVRSVRRVTCTVINVLVQAGFTRVTAKIYGTRGSSVHALSSAVIAGAHSTILAARIERDLTRSVTFRAHPKFFVHDLSFVVPCCTVVS